MVDVDKLSDAELRTKLLEFGFPVMPITGTTRKVMTKKLKLLLENKNRVGSSDGRRSLGRYSSEEESDTDVKSLKKDRNRRATMAAPVSSTTSKSKKIIVEPEHVNTSPRKREGRTTTTTTRTQKIVTTAQDEFDTGSDSESDVLATSQKYDTNLYDSGSKYDDSTNDVEFNKLGSSKKSSLSNSYSRYSPPKSEDLSYSSPKVYNSSSPSRYTSAGGSLASDYAADRLNQIRSRLSLSTSGYEKPASYLSSNNDAVEEKDTPFLSNFTKRLSSLSASKKSDFNTRNDMVKEHDTNGSSLYGKSYLSNFKSNRNRENAYAYKTRDNDGKSNFVSYAVLAGAALFFVFLAVVYLGMKSDTSVVTSGFVTPICTPFRNKIGFNCINPEDAQDAVNLLNSIKPELQKRSVASRCFDSTIKPQMTESEIVTFCQTNYAIDDINIIMNDLRNLELMIFSNPEWGVSIAQTENNNGPVSEDNVVKNMEQVLSKIDSEVTSLIILNPDLPYRCSIYNSITKSLYALTLVGIIFAVLYAFSFGFKIYRRYEEKQKDEINYTVERIIEILQNAALEEGGENYVVINHVRDMILNIKERKAKQYYWDKAVKYINENESRVRTEVQTVHGESFDVWRWIGFSNLSMSGSPRKSAWQGQAFDTHPGSANSPAYPPTPCLKVRGMVGEGAGLNATAAREAVLSKVAHRCRILHCQAEVSSKCVYLRCADAQDAAIAYKNLHGWWYSGQLVTVKYLRLERYQQRYPDAPSSPPYLKSANPCD